MRVRDLPAYRVKPDLVGRTVLIIGNGMSCMDIPKEVLSNPSVYSMVMNSGMHLFPNASMMMCTDKPWLMEYGNDLWVFKGPLIIVTRKEALPRNIDPRVQFIPRAAVQRSKGDIFSSRNVLYEGHTSVSTCISLAVLRGARRVLLSGVDMAPGADGRRRAFGPALDTRPRPRRYDIQCQHLEAQAVWVRLRGVEVLNCSYPSQFTSYPMADLRQELAKCP